MFERKIREEIKFMYVCMYVCLIKSENTVFRELLILAKDYVFMFNSVQLLITPDILWMVQHLYLIATSTFQAGKSRFLLPIIMRIDATT